MLLLHACTGTLAARLGSDAGTVNDADGSPATDASTDVATDTAVDLPDATVDAYSDAPVDAAADVTVDAPPSGPTLVELALGGYHSCALVSDGSVWCWGSNGAGALGNGTYDDSWVPTRVDFSGVAVQIAAGYQFSCLLDDTHAMWCWGANNRGALGTGDAFTTRVPTAVLLADVQRMPFHDLGHWHGAAITLTDQAATWGNNNTGQLGTGSFDPDTPAPPAHPTPALVPALSDITQLALGEFHDCALHSDRTVSCWGSNGWGELGLGDYSVDPIGTPTAVPGLADVTQVAASQQNSCALLADRTLTCWGKNTSGKLGDGTTGAHFSPRAVTGLTAVTQVALAFGHSCAVKTDGTLWCWGANACGQLGNGEIDVDPPEGPPPPHPTPQVVPGLDGVVQVALGDCHTCVLRDDSTIWCWGANADGRIGDGSDQPRLTPTRVAWP